ncbi:MAG: bifunctional diaminohydroxyphosphoribosylaminopyrimidine deaminase/5-amino-6-(5-phosphoribosylamino)uracil reductase RibD [Spirochaetia bacterium]|nr:bifunctional diaminohydroxyphosphoribosylaminopyrimidine deaminase/5-amino-6-(5-phosphoribosylamino)uracil reductase RibD [Spirochaetia bacterium]
MPEQQFMRHAIALALKGEGKTRPNPLVGAVIVKDGRIIGEGYHTKYGSLHAEREALADCRRRGESPLGADMYVTLEPCCHTGKQPPCTEALAESGIGRVFVGSEDPNPLVAGKGIKFLRQHGIQVQTGFLKAECDALNPIFFHYIAAGKPYVALKYAMTADGRIATVTGASKWITGEAARNHVHRLRNRYASILVGINTVLRDDPLLNCRIPGGVNPLRIVLDSALRIPLSSHLVQSAKEIPLMVVCSDSKIKGAADKKKALEAAGAEVLPLDSPDGRPDFKALVAELGKRSIDSLLIEGGSQVHYSALKAGVVSHIYSYVAPKIFGGTSAPGPVGGYGADAVSDAFVLHLAGIQQLGADILIEYEVEDVYRNN